MGIEWRYSDGGRKKYYKARDVKDCACRALALCMDRDYKVCYDICNKYIRAICFSNPTVRNGMPVNAIKNMMKGLGFKRVNCENKNVHLSDIAKKKGTFYIVTKGHALCMRDGVIYDTWNSGASDAKVRFYWRICNAESC